MSRTCSDSSMSRVYGDSYFGGVSRVPNGCHNPAKHNGTDHSLIAAPVDGLLKGQFSICYRACTTPGFLRPRATGFRSPCPLLVRDGAGPATLTTPIAFRDHDDSDSLTKSVWRLPKTVGIGIERHSLRFFAGVGVLLRNHHSDPYRRLTGNEASKRAN